MAIVSEPKQQNIILCSDNPATIRAGYGSNGHTGSQFEGIDIDPCTNRGKCDGENRLFERQVEDRIVTGGQFFRFFRTATSSDRPASVDYVTSV